MKCIHCGAPIVHINGPGEENDHVHVAAPCCNKPEPDNEETYSYDEIVSATYPLLDHPDPAIAKLARCVRSMARELYREESYRLEMKERELGF